MASDQAINPMAQQLGAQLPLKDIHLPAEISAWPPAPGWWLLAVLIIGLLVLAVRWWKRRQRHPVTLALRELKIIENGDQCSNADQALALSRLLRRTALSLYPREQVASLTGDAWREFLCRESMKKPGGYVEVTELQQAILMPEPQFDQAKTVRWVRRWLKAQRKRRQGVSH